MSASIWSPNAPYVSATAGRTILDYLPPTFDTATGDATAYIQESFDSGYLFIDYLGLPLKTDQVTAPANFRGTNIDFTKYTDAAGDILHVNSGNTFTGKLRGTGLTSVVQRGVYPAGAGVDGVTLMLEVSNITFGVHAAPVAAASAANNPSGWVVYLHANDIVGTVAASEGYGFLGETIQDSTIHVIAKNIRRHAGYLSAGACGNDMTVTVDGCGNYAAQINTSFLSGQEASQYNTVTVYAKNLTTDVATQSGALAIAGRSHYNTCTVFCDGSAFGASPSTVYEAVRVEGGSVGNQEDHPRGNKIVNGAIRGKFAGNDVIRMLNADGTIVTGNTIVAVSADTLIACRRTGTNLSLHGGYIDNNILDANGSALKGIFTEINTVPSYIGPNEISNNAGAIRVDDQSGGWRTGFSRRLTFNGTTGSISSASVGDTVVTFPLSREVAVAGRRANVVLTGGSVSFTNPHAVIRYTHTSATVLTFRAYNAAGSAQTFDYEGWVEGD